MRSILVFSLTFLLAACVIHRLDVTPIEVTAVDPIVVSTPVKAHLEDGSTVVFPDGVSVANGVVSGNGTIYNLTLDNSSLISEITPLEEPDRSVLAEIVAAPARQFVVAVFLFEKLAIYVER